MPSLESIQPYLPLILMFGLLYFLFIRPQQAQQRKRQEMLSQIKRGDQVITIGGIHGEITVVTDNIVRLKVSDGVELEMNKSGVGTVKSDEDD